MGRNLPLKIPIPVNGERHQRILLSAPPHDARDFSSQPLYTTLICSQICRSNTTSASSHTLIKLSSFGLLVDLSPWLRFKDAKKRPIDKKAADPLDLYQRLKLHHSMPLVSAYSSLLQSGRVEEQEKKKDEPPN